MNLEAFASELLGTAPSRRRAPRSAASASHLVPGPMSPS